MNVERRAEIVKQPAALQEKAVQTHRAEIGQKTIEVYVERLTAAAGRLRRGPEASELFCAAAELHEGKSESDPAKATELYGRALDAFALSRPAHLGLKRLARQGGDAGSTIAALEREIANASGTRQVMLRFELVRSLLYQADKPHEALIVLEALEEERLKKFNRSQQVGPTPEGFLAALDGDGDKAAAQMNDASAEKVPSWMGISAFFLWEEVLWATAQWRRYEELLRSVLAKQNHIDAVAQMIERRLLHLYQYIIPDGRQAEIIINHLIGHGELDPEIVELAIRRMEREGEFDQMVDLLTRALVEPACADQETAYRMLLADIARHHFNDPDHAADIIRAGHENKPKEPILIHELLSLQEERGDQPALVDALGASLEILSDPAERADTMHRIGFILMTELKLEEAAEEVFQEAIAQHPTHQATLRSLGRLYQKREDWYALAGLYEDEVAASSHSNTWRKHFQLGELYEERLSKPEAAFEQYTAALAMVPAYLPALKGASRIAARLGTWPELLRLYAAAEAATKDQRQRVYLLDRIAQIAEEQLSDMETACTALEGLRVIDPQNPNAVTSLARLYAQLGRYRELVALTREELEWTVDDESAAAMLVRIAEICEVHLDNANEAKELYRQALQRIPTFLPALEGLGRLLQRQGCWQELVDMGIAEADAWGDSPEANRRLTAVADILEHRLNRADEAIEIYWRCVESNPADRTARNSLARLYRSAGEWEKVCQIMEIEAEHGGVGGYPGATLFRLGQVKEHRLNDAEGALDAYRRAFLSDPSNPVLMRAWLSTARKLGSLDGPKKILASASAKPAGEASRVDLLLALAEFSLLESHDPLTAAGFLEIVDQIAPEREAGATLLSMAFARSGRWKDRVRLALREHRTAEERLHGLDASLPLGLPEEFAPTCRKLLTRLDGDAETLIRTWSLFPPAERPEARKLPPKVKRSTSPEAQDLRRWSTLKALESGQCPEPSAFLLPDAEEHHLTLRPDMELLAAHYQVTESWEKLLEVLEAQEEMAPTDSELVRITLERAQVLGKLGLDRKAIDVLRSGFEHCAWGSEVRIDLYDALEAANDWDALVAELRRHLMHTESPAAQAELWLRLSRALETGLGDLHEALRALDAAYRAHPADGAFLPEIARVAEELGEVNIARRAMDDYISYHEPPIEAELAVCKRLVELHIDYTGGEPRQVIAYLEDLVQRSCDDRRALEALADAHSKAGDPQIACESIARLARLPYQEKDLHLWLELASLHAYKLQQTEKAEALYWEILANFPNQENVWKEIDQFYEDDEARHRLTDKLRAFVNNDTNPLDVETKRHYLSILGRILGDELGLWRDARQVFSDAIDLAALAPEDLSKQRAYAMCKIPGERSSAYRGFCDLLVENPFQPEILRAAIALTENVQAYDRARILRQVAAFFMPSEKLHLQDSDLRAKVDVTRQIDDSILSERLLHPSLRPIYGVLHESLPIIETVFKDAIPNLSVVGGKRVRGKDETSELFNQVAARLGLGSVKVFLGNDESPVPMVFSSPTSFWIPSDRWQQMSESERRHWAGFAAGLIWTGLSPFVYLNGRDVWQLLDGIKYGATGDGIQGRTAYTLEAAEKVKSPWYRRAKKEISALLNEAGSAMNAASSERWGEWLQSTGDRCGLLFGGDIGSSLGALLAGEGWRNDALDEASIQRHLQRLPRMRQLLDFALSEDYLELRHAAGLAQAPSNISG